MTACSTNGSNTKTQIVELKVPTPERLDERLLVRRPIPKPPEPNCVDPSTLRPTICGNVLEKYLSAVFLYIFTVDGQIRDIIVAQPEKQQ